MVYNVNIDCIIYTYTHTNTHTHTCIYTIYTTAYVHNFMFT